MWMGAGVLGILLVWFLLQLPFRDITTPPPEQARGSDELDTELSYLSIPVRLPLEAIEAFANQEISEELVNKKENRKYKVRILGIPTTYEGLVRTVVRRRGPVKISTSDDALLVSIPLGFRVRMDGEGIFDPDAKADGALTITAKFRLGVDEFWQARLEADADYEWDRKPHVRIGPFRARVSNLMGKELEGRIDAAINKLKDRVNRDWNLRERAAERWHELHHVRHLSDRLGAWLVVDPASAFFPPVRYEPDALIIEFGLGAYLSTAVGQVPAPPAPEPLPELTLGPAPLDGFSIRLPVRLNYAGMRKKILQAQSERTITLEEGELNIEDIKLYSSEQSLVVAARIIASSPTRLFNTRGWVYLVGRPVYDSEKRILYVEDLDFSRQVDNPLVSGASWVLQDSLRQRLRAHLQFDLHDRIEELKESANQSLNRPVGEGFFLAGDLQHLNLAYLLPQEDDLLLVLSAQGQLAISSALHQIALDRPGSPSSAHLEEYKNEQTTQPGLP